MVKDKDRNIVLHFSAFMKINNINSSQTYTYTHIAIYTVIKLLISVRIKCFYISVLGQSPSVLGIFTVAAPGLSPTGRERRGRWLYE